MCRRIICSRSETLFGFPIKVGLKPSPLLDEDIYLQIETEVVSVIKMKMADTDEAVVEVTEYIDIVQEHDNITT